MDDYPHPTAIEIDTAQFKKNIGLIQAFIGSVRLCLPVKANAYGHGLVPTAKVAALAGVDVLAVAHLKEGMKLRRAGIELPILVLGAIHEEQICDLIEHNLEFSISSKYKADLVARHCHKSNLKCRVHLEVDTGMQRTGVRAQSSSDLYRHLKALNCFDIVGIYSHLATADRPEDPFAREQIAAFDSLVKRAPFDQEEIVRHIANSGGTLYFPEAHFDMVRPSWLAFGYAPADLPVALKGIAPCFSLKTKVAYFKVVEAGMGISYGHTYRTQKRTRIVTIPIGYGDGYRRALSNRGHVLIRGRRFPIVGMICMDQFMVDVGDCDVYVGDEVVLIGRQGDQEITVDEIARLCDTIPYEILCSFNERIPRIYR